MDNVVPVTIVSEALGLAQKKAALSVRDLLVRGMLAGGFLAYATSVVFVILSQGLPPIVGAIVFPCGFVMLVLLGFELVTGNFALLPAAWMARRVSAAAMLRNWAWVYAGNLIGSMLYALLFYVSISSFGSNNGGPVAELVKQAALKKTAGYAALGAAGWSTAFVKAMLCNWMVTVGAVLALASRSTVGKILAMWLPIMMFFAMGYEHSVVNMFVIPTGMLAGAPISAGQWWMWNQVPVTLGNIAGGAVFTGMALWYTYAPREEAEARSAAEAGALAEAS